jgi:hypothetical protein
VAEFEAEYGPCIDGEDPPEPFAMTLGGRPVGFVLCHDLADHPEQAERLGGTGAVGIDGFLGQGPRAPLCATERRECAIVHRWTLPPAGCRSGGRC